MRKLFTTMLCVLLAGSSVFGQQRTCGAMDHLQHQMQNDPAAQRNHQKMNAAVNEWVRLHGNENRAGGVVTIPVVVHVVYRNAAQNISQAQIQSQIDVLNADYRRLNADASNVPAAWTNIASDAGIAFCLAQRDPNGAPTSGINRVSTTVNTFGLNDAVKYTAQGGADAWPRNQYLNIWVCNLGSQLLGYAQFPGQPAATDGVVIGYNYFGTSGTVSAPFNKGRTTTHEVGHWLGLYHIWGDDGGACNGSDNVSDTPNQASETYGTYAPGTVRTDACAPNAPGYMWMNYMDYTDDAAMYMFTTGQANVMNGILNTSRVGLQSSLGCTPIVLQQNDAAISSITAPTGTLCAAAVTPVVVLFNWGSSALTSVTINWQIDGGAVNTFNWTGNLASLASVSVTLPSTNVGTGAHTISVYTTLPNGQADGNASNDASSGTFTTTSASSSQPTPFTYGFQPTTFVPTNWSLFNPDGGETWQRSGTVGNGSTASAWVNNFDYNANGEIDDLILPALNFTGLGNPTLTFDVAYALYSQTGFSDTLRVLASSDCGATWTTVYNKFGQPLTTVTPYFQTPAFVPNSASQWRNETVNLSAFAGQAGVILKFRNITNYENNLYIDNVNILSPVSINEGDLSQAVSLSPNPGRDMFSVSVNLPNASDLSLEVYSSFGKRIYRTERAAFTQGRIELDLAGHAAGVYYVRVNSGDAATVKKLIKL
jgi:hypothetical protein